MNNYKVKLVLRNMLLESESSLKRVNCGFIQYQTLIDYYEPIKNPLYLKEVKKEGLKDNGNK